MSAGTRNIVSLKTKLLALVGGTVALLMLVIFVGVALTGRALLLRFLKEDAVSVTRAFAVPVMETLIYSENGYVQREDQLDKSIDQFIRQEQRVREITVFDSDGKVISGSNLAERQFRAHARRPVALAGIVEPVTMVYRDWQHGWIVGAILPLKIGNRSWGFLEMLLDAEPAWRRLVALFWALAASGVLVTSGVLVVLSVLMGRATNSLKALAAAMDRLELDSEDSISLPETNDELGTVVRHFLQLKDRLTQSRRQLVEAQKQIFHAEKLASIGRLASGVAHEVNNPLNGIRHCLFAIRQEPGNHEQLTEFLGLIDEGLAHIEMVVQKLLQFAHKQSETSLPVDVNAGIRMVLALLDYRLKQHRVDVRLELDPNLPAVMADPQLLQEVFMNLLLNSFDAVEEAGQVEVRTVAEDSGFASVVVRDNGLGIAEADLPHIFEPFFSTKEPGKGTGLGLSVAQSIIEAYGGTIGVESRQGVGSTFIVRLPIRGRE
jgi:two-component system NtrC family sensor kinase